jgi:rSAM/selenodomain-associated transferase 1
MNLMTGKDFEILIMFWPPDSYSEIRQWLQPEFQLEVQIEGDLGARMLDAFSKAFKKNYQNVIIIGSDLPNLTHNFILEAFNDLQTVDLLLGPSSDGGYYLIGLKKPYPVLFEEISWSTSRVLEKTIAHSENAGISFKLLQELRDIDTYEDLKFLENLIETTDIHTDLSHTYSVLKKII